MNGQTNSNGKRQIRFLPQNASDLRTSIVGKCHAFSALDRIVEEFKEKLDLNGTIPEKIPTKELKEDMVGIARFMMTAHFKTLPAAEQAKVKADYDAKEFLLWQASKRNSARAGLLAKAKSQGWLWQGYNLLVREREKIRADIMKTLRMTDRTLAEVAPEFASDVSAENTDLTEDDVAEDSNEAAETEATMADLPANPTTTAVPQGITPSVVTTHATPDRPVLSTAPVEAPKVPSDTIQAEPSQ